MAKTMKGQVKVLYLRDKYAILIEQSQVKDNTPFIKYTRWDGKGKVLIPSDVLYRSGVAISDDKTFTFDGFLFHIIREDLISDQYECEIG